MISLELSLALQKTGLVWEPTVDDKHLLYGDGGEVFAETIKDLKDINSAKFLIKHEPEGLLWLPRLDQLLTEIEARGYLWNLNKFRCCIISEVDYNNKNWKAEKKFKDNPSPEDAAARALIWILERGRCGEA